MFDPLAGLNMAGDAGERPMPILFVSRSNNRLADEGKLERVDGRECHYY